MIDGRDVGRSRFHPFEGPQVSCRLKGGGCPSGIVVKSALIHLLDSGLAEDAQAVFFSCLHPGQNLRFTDALREVTDAQRPLPPRPPFARWVGEINLGQIWGEKQEKETKRDPVTKVKVPRGPPHPVFTVQVT